jgi:hypothetical protein
MKSYLEILQQKYIKNKAKEIDITSTIAHNIQNKETKEITSTDNLYPYWPIENKYDPIINYHGDTCIMYPLFNANILLNITYHLVKQTNTTNYNNGYYIYNEFNNISLIPNDYKPKDILIGKFKDTDTLKGGKFKKITKLRAKKSS